MSELETPLAILLVALTTATVAGWAGYSIGHQLGAMPPVPIAIVLQQRGD